MITHWVEAMGDRNPVYVDDDAARAAGFPGVIAPPTMLQAWTMRGLRASLEADADRAAGRASADSPSDQVMALLDRGRVHLGGRHQLRPALRAARSSPATTSRSPR